MQVHDMRHAHQHEDQHLSLIHILSGAIMSWVTVISELSSSIMLYRASTQTLTVSI